MSTRKVVINRCHGGFGLSWAAMRRLAERKGLVASYFATDYGGRERLEDGTMDPDGFGVVHVIDDKPHTAWPEGTTRSTMRFDSDFERDDPDLVAVVEELGDAANKWAAKLDVVEIPDDIEWTIEEYDGSEWIAERHRTWS